MIDLSIKNKSYRGRTVIESSDLHLPSTGLFMIAGKNGSGKSTLLRIMYGDEDFEGTYTIDGKDYREIDFKSKISLTAPNSVVMSSFSAVDNVLYLYRDRDRKKAISLLDALGLSNVLDKKAKTLSVGEKRRLSLAIELYGDKEIILCDEPLVSLDDVNQARVISLLSEYSRDHLVLFSNHEILAEELREKIECLSIADRQITFTATETEGRKRALAPVALRNPFQLFGSFIFKHLAYVLTSVFILTAFLSLTAVFSLVGNTDSDQTDARLEFESTRYNTDYMALLYPISDERLKSPDTFFIRNIWTGFNPAVPDEYTHNFPYDGSVFEIFFANDGFFDGYDLECGRYPASSSEIIISSLAYEAYINEGFATSFEDLKEKTIAYRSDEFQIVGVYETSLAYFEDNPRIKALEKAGLDSSSAYDLHYGYVSAVGDEPLDYFLEHDVPAKLSSSLSFERDRDAVMILGGVMADKEKMANSKNIITLCRTFMYYMIGLDALFFVLYLIIFKKNLSKDLEFINYHLSRRKIRLSNFLGSAAINFAIPAVLAIFSSWIGLLRLSSIAKEAYALPRSYFAFSFTYPLLYTVLAVILFELLLCFLTSLKSSLKRR